MSRSARLGQILGFLHHREQDAARALAKQQAQLSASQDLLVQLQSYRQQSGQQIAGGEVQRSSELIQQRDFLESMDRAISEQRSAVAQATERYQSQKNDWLARRVRRRALGRAVTKLLRDEEKAQRRQEQRAMDDLVMRRFQGMSEASD